MKKQLAKSQTSEQMKIYEELRKSEALRAIDESLKALKIGKYAPADPSSKSDLCLVKTVEYYRRLAVGYEEYGDAESAGKTWETLLNTLSRRSSEIALIEEDANNYRAFINRSMIEAYSYLGRNSLEYFMIALELGMPDERRFYCTRRNIISADAAEIQKLEDGKYDMLGISAPPRTYKTALGTRYLTFTTARHREESSFFASHSSKMARKVMEDCLKIFSSLEFQRVFPEITVESNKEDMWIDLFPKAYDNGYHTIYFAGIDNQMAGVINCSWLLYCDDLIASVMEAANPDRVANALEKYTGDIRQRRASDNVRELIIATRFATKDPITYMEETHLGNSRYRFIKRPALDENGESNFMYSYKPLTAKHFLDIKSHMSEIAFECVYQQNPLDREGLIFTDLKRYKEMPAENPDAVYMACDVAFSGSDNLSAPVAYQFGDDVYISDVVFSPEGYTTTEPLVQAFMVKHAPNFAKFESNNGGDFYAKDIKNAVENIIKTRIYSERTKSNKLVRISQFEPIIQQFYFKDRSLYQPGSMYDKFIREIEHFNINGKNKHDDAVDSLAMIAEMKRNSQSSGGVFVMKRKGKKRFGVR